MDWKISCLTYGKLEFPKAVVTPNLDTDLRIWGPYLGFLLQNGRRNILVDAGINTRFIKDGKAWGGLPAEGGEKHVLASLEKAGVSPKDIEMVIYTHLHNDHAGNCHLFPEAQHVFQKDEWYELLEPLPHEKVREDYDQGAIPELQKLDRRIVTGNFQLAPGIMCYHTSGHTAGSMALTVDTTKGMYVITGDTTLWKCSLYPQMDKMISMEGKEIKITPAPKTIGPAIPPILVNSYFEWLKSIYLLKTLCEGPDFLLTGHDPSHTDKVFS